MNWDIFGLDSTRRLREMRERMESQIPCTSWYGHNFRKFDAETVFCPICGAIKKVSK